ncbi:MAG: TerC family protein [Fibrobacter sp.]|nr:TerC family protein [Fibrobacter sp.]
MVLFWILFLALVAILLALDLGVFHKKDHVIGVGESLRWTGVWIGVSLLFSVAIYFLYGKGFLQGPAGNIAGSEALLEYLTGYIIEKSLSMDNIFVMVAIFGYFKIPALHQHRVLFWGILGAIVLRGIFIIGGTALINNFSWLMYVFGVIILISAVKMLFGGEEDDDMGNNRIVKIATKFLPVTRNHHGHDFTIVENGKRLFTPLFVALVVIELSDVLFAVDSIPAIFGVTTDPFIVFTSNIMAILGLRSLYFALAAMLTKFSLLKYAIVFILAFVGVKMLIVEFVHIPTLTSLAVIVAALSIGVVASLVRK